MPDIGEPGPADRVGAALEAHAEQAREIGLCPRLHELDESGVCRECTIPIPVITGYGPGDYDDDEPPVLVG